MPINAHPDYVEAEKEYHNAESLEERIEKLKKMISLAPAHKGAENLRSQLKTRLKKFQEDLNKQKKSGKSSKVSIRKEELQCVIIGKTNSGKSSLLKLLTNAEPRISELKFSTTEPKLGILNYATTQIQMVEIPATDSEYFDKGILYTADTVLLLTESFEDLDEILKTTKTQGKIIIVFNKTDKLSENEKRKTSATLKSKYKKYDFILISTKTKENIEELKEKIFGSFEALRIYTRQPEEKKKSEKPMILPPNSTVGDAAEKILKGFSKRIKQARIWGPSSKFPGQIVGLKHKIKDKDVVEFKTK